MYRPVAFNPFNAEDTPSRSKIIEISGNSIPCEKPEIDTINTRMANLFFAVIREVCHHFLQHQVVFPNNSIPKSLSAHHM